jgi:hypothetical protein
MYSSGLSSLARTAPASTSETATAKLPARVIQVRAFGSVSCGGILPNSALEAGRGRLSGMAKLLAATSIAHDRQDAALAPRNPGRISARETGRGGRGPRPGWPW